MSSISTGQMRDELAEVVNRVALDKERIVLTRRGRRVAAIVPIEDLQALEELEAAQDQQENEACDQAHEVFLRGETIPWAEAKKKLGL